MRMKLCVLLLTGAAACMTTLQAQGQQNAAPAHREIDLALMYSAGHSNLTSTPEFWTQGGAFELNAEIYHGLGIAVDGTGERATNIGGSTVNLTTVSTTFGPRYAWAPKSDRYSIFGHGLIGESHGLDSVFPSTGGALTSYGAFALQVGGGIDLRLSRRFAVRAVQADWFRTQFPNGNTNVQNNLRLSGGVVLRLPY